MTLPGLWTPYDGAMTSGGITRRTFCVWATVAFCLIAMLCALEFKTGGDPVYRGLAILSFVFGLISLAGAWASRLTKSEDAEDAEWMDATK